MHIFCSHYLDISEESVAVAFNYHDNKTRLKLKETWDLFFIILTVICFITIMRLIILHMYTLYSNIVRIEWAINTLLNKIHYSIYSYIFWPCIVKYLTSLRTVPDKLENVLPYWNNYLILKRCFLLRNSPVDYML